MNSTLEINLNRIKDLDNVCRSIVEHIISLEEESPIDEKDDIICVNTET